MIRLTGYYPNKPGATFDWDYYMAKHVVSFRDHLAPAGIESIVVERGVAGGQPGTAAPNVCVFHAVLRDPAKFAELMALHGPAIMADVPNFTNTEPVVQLGEIVDER